MCASSAISDYYMHREWPHWPNPGPPAQWPPQMPFQQFIQSDPELKDMLRKTIQLLDKIDKKLGDRDCLDETKAEFYRALDLEPPSKDGSVSES